MNLGFGVSFTMFYPFEQDDHVKTHLVSIGSQYHTLLRIIL